MVYTNNVPQSNQRIADTQPLIQANFGFLEDAIGQEHNFNATDPTQTYHLQASMPNEADPSALPDGTNGIYYVGAGQPKFYNANGAFFLTPSTAYSYVVSATGVVLLGFPTNAPKLIYTVPINSSGTIYIFGASNTVYLMGNFNSSSTTVNIHSTNTSGDMVFSNSGLSIRATNQNSSNLTVSWVITVFTP